MRTSWKHGAAPAICRIRGVRAGSRPPLTKRADLEHLAVIAGLARNDELPAAIVAGHHRHHGDDGLAAGLCERRADARLLAELDQVARGGEWQLEPAALAARKRLPGRDPDRIRRFLAVMGAELIGRRGGQEEPGVEALRHALRRDPMRIGDEFVEREPELVVGEHVEKGRLALAKRRAIRRLDLARAAGVDEGSRALLAREQDAALLEGLADRRHPEAQRERVEAL